MFVSGWKRQRRIKMVLSHLLLPYESSVSMKENPDRKKGEENNHLAALSNSFNLNSSKHEIVLLLVNFNIEIEDSNIQLFCETYKVKSLTKKPTSQKKNWQTYIDVILTNVPRMSKHICDRDRAIRILSIDSDYYKKSVLKGNI